MGRGCGPSFRAAKRNLARLTRAIRIGPEGNGSSRAARWLGEAPGWLVERDSPGSVPAVKGTAGASVLAELIALDLPVELDQSLSI
jgi:hypothetical protein